MINLLLGAIIGYLSAFLLRSWQYRRDVWLKRVEKLCDTLDGAAEAGTKYWLQSRSAESATAEARILGLQSRIDGMFAGLELDRTSNPRLVELLNNFRDSLTGGNFEGAERETDHDRARLTQMYASELIVEIWAAAYAELSLEQWWHRRVAQGTASSEWLTVKLRAVRDRAR